MQNCDRKALDRLQHHNPKRPQYAPYRWSVPAYGKIPQMKPDLFKSNLLEDPTKRIQSIVGTMIYYARSVYPTMLQAINKILRVQSRPTWDTAGKSRILLGYASM